MRKRYRKRHVFGSIVICISEHHALIARADIELSFTPGLERVINALRDIGRLLVYRCHYRTCLIVKAHITAVVTDLLQRFPCDTRYVDIGCRSYLACDHYHSRCGKSLTCNASFRIGFEYRIEYCIGDLITDFIRMSFSNRFRCKQPFSVLFLHIDMTAFAGVLTEYSNIFRPYPQPDLCRFLSFFVGFS